MTGHSFINVVIPFECQRSEAVNDVLRTLTEPGDGNRPKKEIEGTLTNIDTVHFMSITVVDPTCPSERDGSSGDKPAAPARTESHLIIEISADGGTEETLTLLAHRIGPELSRILVAANLTVCQESLKGYLSRHSREIGASWGSNALGQIFTGSPGMSARRILDEKDLAKRIDRQIEEDRRQSDWQKRSPRQRLDSLRNRLWEEGEWKWAFVQEPAPCLAGDPHNKWRADLKVSNPQVWKAGLTILNDLLWPLYLPFLVVVLAVLALTWRNHGPNAEVMWTTDVILGLLGGLVVALAAVFGAAYGWLRGGLIAFALFALAALALAWRYYGPAVELPPNADVNFWLPVGLLLALAAAFGAAYGWLRRGLIVFALFVLAALFLAWRYYGPIVELVQTPDASFWLLVGLLVALAAISETYLWLRLVLIVFAVTALTWRYYGLMVELMWTAYVIAGLLAGFFVALAAFFGAILLRLRRLEEKDLVEDRTPSSPEVEKLMKVENFCAQNHLASVSRLKPGLLRRLTLRLAFIVVGTGRFVCAPGFLGKNGVIHFARWMRLPGTDQLLFLSNYDGTWESYVADFIADAPTGVSGIWSNCVGFPRTHYLFGGGAANRDRLVRWARRQQHPTIFWYSAYRDLTAERIRTNAAIRQGLASADSDADARDWFALFGSKPRPPEALQVTQIPTLVFGGLSSLRYAECHVMTFDDRADKEKSKKWLAAAAKHAAYGEMLPGQKSAVVVALSATGLAKLGVPDDALETFPVAFQQGMWPESRARELGDTGDNEPQQWEWGYRRADVLLIAYGFEEDDLRKAQEGLIDEAKKLGHVYPIPLKPLPLKPLPDKAAVAKGDGGDAKHREFPKELFGFADGVSQPVIRGAPRSNTRGAPNDLVAPGEIVLGYPDNLCQIPPSPSISDEHDLGRLLPDVGPDPFRRRPEFSRYEGTGRRDLGANGTFLVVRQLEQDVKAFEDWLETALEQIRNDAIVAADQKRTAIVWGRQDLDAVTASVLPRPRVKNLSTPKLERGSAERERVKDAIAAKLIGRWKNGTSLVRNPLMPGPEQDPSMLPDNDFLLGAEDPSGLSCPFGAHIRRANPRDTRFPGSDEEIATINRHRILRVGRTYERPDPKDPTKLDKGLLFMCLNADIERQFEFIQKTWLLNRNLHGLENEIDPIIGRGPRILTVPTPTGTVRLEIDQNFVTVKGGGYFFLPGRAVLHYLAA